MDRQTDSQTSEGDNLIHQKEVDGYQNKLYSKNLFFLIPNSIDPDDMPHMHLHH